MGYLGDTTLFNGHGLYYVVLLKDPLKAAGLVTPGVILGGTVCKVWGYQLVIHIRTLWCIKEVCFYYFLFN